VKMNNIIDFFDAVETNNQALVEQMLNSGLDYNQTNKLGYSALHRSCYNGFDDLSVYLINVGIDVNIQDNVGATALHYTAQYGQFAVAKLILEKGGSLNISDRYGNEPLWVAVFNDKGRDSRYEMVELFVKYGADVNRKNKAAKSPKEFAQYANYKNLEGLLT